MADSICAHCVETILPEEPRMPFNGGLVVMHRNCGLRGILGSLAHVQGRCSCYVPGSTAGDPEGLTLRQAAEAAVEEWKRISDVLLERQLLEPLEALRRLGIHPALPRCSGGDGKEETP